HLVMSAAPTPQSPPRRRISRAERRAQLLAVARQEFARAGYRGTTTLGIAQAAGVSEALVVQHFGTKEALFREAAVDGFVAILDRGRATNLEPAATTSASPGDDYARLRESLLEWMALVKAERELIRSVLAESRDFPDVASGLVDLFAEHAEGAVD